MREEKGWREKGKKKHDRNGEEKGKRKKVGGGRQTHVCPEASVHCVHHFLITLLLTYRVGRFTDTG